jgi:hypothetical protein
MLRPNDVSARRRHRVDLGAILVAVVEHPGVQAAVDALTERKGAGLVRSGGEAVQ